MGCSVYWRPFKPGRHSAGGSTLIAAIREEFGDFPIRLDAQALPYLRGLRAAHIDGAADLMDAIGKHGRIELEVEC